LAISNKEAHQALEEPLRHPASTLWILTPFGDAAMLRKEVRLVILMLLTVAALLPAGTEIIAHRGASGLAPENTLASFTRAVEIGAGWFELDVWLSRDDSLMLMHDESVARTTGSSGTIPTLTYAQLRALDAGSWFSPLFAGEKIPTLGEALDLAVHASYPVGVVIEIKGSNPAIVDKVVAAVHQRGLQERVIISSFDFGHISKSRLLDPSIAVQLFGDISLAQIRQVAAIGGAWVGTNGTITTALLDSAHVRGMRVNKWTVDSATEMTTLIHQGVDAITTNYPNIARALLDTTPPGEVVLLAPLVEETRIGLSWLPAPDPESTSITYEIYRDTRAHPETLLATVTDTTAYIDDTRRESQQYFYRIRARNVAGLYSPGFSNEVEATTAPDLQPPNITAVQAYGRADQVVVRFNERIEKTSAEQAANFLIAPGITVTGARLALDSLSVILVTSPLTDGSAYTLTVTGITDQALHPNTRVETETVPFTYQAYLPGLVAAWDFNEAEGTTLPDHSGNANHGALQNGITWSGGHSGNSLRFDGSDDYVLVPASPSLDLNTPAVTLSLWTWMDYVPNTLPGAFGPLYDSESDTYVLYEDKGIHELRFKVTTTVSAERPGIRSADLAAGEWIHLAGVYDGAKAMIYLNGELKDSHPLTGTVKAGQIATIGKTGGVYFKGRIDDIQIFNRALSADEIRFLGGRGTLINSVAAPAQQPQLFNLQQNYPNPFNPATTLVYVLARKATVELAVYDLLGRKVAELVRATQGPGTYQATWDGTTLQGLPAGSGQYFARLTSGSLRAVRTMLLLR